MVIPEYRYIGIFVWKTCCIQMYLDIRLVGNEESEYI